MASKIKAQTQEYKEGLQRNELDANKQMVKVCAAASLVLVVIWVLYLAHVFPLRDYTLVDIILPIDALILFSPVAFQFTPLFKKKGFKYFLLFGFLLVVGVVNILLPKHGILGYAAVIAVSAHYYSPKVGRIIFGSTLAVMLFCLYLGMFLGEYDPNLLRGGIVAYNEAGESYIYEPLTATERIEYLHNMMVNENRNRYLEVFVFYFLSRAALLLIIFFAIEGLERRTFKLLNEEVTMTVEKKTMETELAFAKQIQLASLPNVFKTTDDVDIIAEMNPAKAVGGDFYNYFILDSERIAITIGDVSGKGAPAALFMMRTVACLKNAMEGNISPAAILTSVNKQLCEGNSSEMFVTCFLGIFNVKTGLFVYANAGHNKPIVSIRGRKFYLPCHAGFVLGADEEMTYVDETAKLEKGDYIFLYTDGVTEAKNDQGAFYGEKALLAFFEKTRLYSLMQFQYDFKTEIEEFVKGAEQSDDLTYLIMQRQDDQIRARELLITSKADDTPRLFEFVKDNCKANDLPSSAERTLLVVLDELFSNISKFAYGSGVGDVYARFQFDKTTRTVTFLLADRGLPFNQFSVDNKAIDSDFEDREEGGLGILIVKNSVDKYDYMRIKDMNVLSFSKTF